MLRKVMVLVAVAVFLIGVDCTSDPSVPDKGAEDTISSYFNSIDLSNPAVAEFTYSDFDGNVLASGTFGRNEDGTLYILESRGAQIDLDVTALGLVIIFITYDNPTGTIPTGPNAGLPYWYIGQTMCYDINILNLLWSQIGSPSDPFGYSGPAELCWEHHYAIFDANGKIVAGPPLPCDDWRECWSGVISPGYNVIHDCFYICPSVSPGLMVTTARLTAPVFFGIIDVIFFDGVAGVWDPQ